jgi:branched-chain amino acid transport system substrate-binding protein
MMRKLLITFLMVLWAVPFASAQDDAPLTIGLLTDQSGPLTIYGIELENGFKLGLLYAAGIDPTEYDSVDAALEDLTIGGRSVQVLLRDNSSDPDTAASQARSLIETDFAEILVGAPSSGVTLSLQQVALDSDVLLFVAPGASPSITQENFNLNTFRVCRNTLQDSRALASFATEGLGENWVILAADYDFGRASAAAFESTLQAFGVNFVQDPIYAPLETTDFTAYLQTVLDSGAEAMLPIWAGDTSVALFQQIAELGVQDQINVVGAFNSNDIVAVSDPSQIGNISWSVYHYTFPQTPANDWLVENHVATYSDYPDLFTECAFATAQALYMSVEEAAGDTLPETLIPLLEGMIFEGPKGTYAIRPSDHQALVPMYVAELDNLDSEVFDFFSLLSEVSLLDAAPPCNLPEDLAERCETDEAFIADVAAYLAEQMGDMGDEATETEETEE